MARMLFIQKFWFEFLGTMVISSVLKQDGHQVELHILNKKESLQSVLAAYKPDIVGIYTVSGSHSWAVKTLQEVKKYAACFTILGGPHPTFFPDIINSEGVDAICIGEGEEAMCELARAIDSQSDYAYIQNLWVKKDRTILKNQIRSLVEDLNDLPMPDRDLYYKYPILRDSPSKHFITGRGCPFNCTFCCNKAYKELYKDLGRMVRRPESRKIISEIQAVKSKYPLKSVRFDDEVFLLEPDWLYEFLSRYKTDVNLPFSCLIRADLAHEKLIVSLRKAGCYIAYFGIESGCDSIRNGILGKQVTTEQIKDTAWLLRKHSIKIGTFNMLGMPGETLEDAWETVRLNQLIKSDQPWCSVIQPYPGTDLERMAKEMGCLDPSYGVDQLNQSYFNDTVIKNKYSSQLLTLQKLFYIAVKFPFLNPIVKKMVGRGANWAGLRWIFTATYAYRYSKTYRMPFWELFKRALLWKDNF